MKNYTVNLSGVCAQAVSFSIDGENIYNINFYGGCPGNTLAISKLLEGTKAQRVVDVLKGNDCGGRGTSCADQLARAVETALNEKN